MPRPPFQNEHDYAAAQEIMRHDDAMAWYGEMSCIIALWNSDDFENGLVARCPECYTAYGKIADAYGQSARFRCPNCLGTTYEGGYRALVYRPTMWGPTDQSDGLGKHGNTKVTTAIVHITSDVQVRDGDYLVRLDGTRWKISAANTQEITTGFGPSYDMVDRSNFTAVREEETSPAFLVSVDIDAMNIVGWQPYMVYPTDSDQLPGPIAYIDSDTWDDAYWDVSEWT